VHGEKALERKFQKPAVWQSSERGWSLYDVMVNKGEGDVYVDFTFENERMNL